uniref:VHS domain-containing protein n=1 Tax=Hanusia phi TaxID=3032 RepID=A0A7S0HJ89_9CRYP|mmetsp:Transcript_21322/g.48150  ORF Transcript_21322/g.48150 Transcript_21322/m.48150 type:complete len:339 (+) Transcript_21322:94-1110(+)
MASQLKSAIQRATTPAEETDEGDPIALIELTEILGQNQKLAGDAVKLIKARIKDKDARISAISMEVLDACMQIGGPALQEIVAKKTLDRVRRIGAGGPQIPEALRNKAANLLLKWGDEYGSDPKFLAFQKAAKEIQYLENKEARMAQVEAMKHESFEAEEEAVAAAQQEDRPPPPPPPPPPTDEMMSPKLFLSTTRENMQLLESMLQENEMKVTQDETLAQVAYGLKLSLRQIEHLATTVQDEEVLTEVLEISDRVHETVNKYDSALESDRREQGLAEGGDLSSLSFNGSPATRPLSSYSSPSSFPSASPHIGPSVSETPSTVFDRSTMGDESGSESD